MVRYVRTRDSRRVGGPILRFLSVSLFSFDSVSLCSFLSLLSHSLIPFCLSSLTLSVPVFILLPSFPFSATLSLFPTFFCLLLFALQLFSFLSLTFFCFLSLPLYSCSLPPCSFLPSSPFLSVLLLLSSLSVALPNVFPGPPLSPGDPGELV